MSHRMAQGKQQLKLREMGLLDSEIIVTQPDGRTNFDCLELC